MPTITIETRTVYGKENIYVMGPEAKLIEQLTGKKTITMNDIAALTALGFTVEEAPKAAKRYQFA